VPPVTPAPPAPSSVVPPVGPTSPPPPTEDLTTFEKLSNLDASTALTVIPSTEAATVMAIVLPVIAVTPPATVASDQSEAMPTVTSSSLSTPPPVTPAPPVVTVSPTIAAVTSEEEKSQPVNLPSMEMLIIPHDDSEDGDDLAASARPDTYSQMSGAKMSKKKFQSRRGIRLKTDLSSEVTGSEILGEAERDESASRVEKPKE